MGKIIVLMVAIMMPGRTPDISHQEKMETIDACWDAAREYTSHELSDEMRKRGAIGLSAGCAAIEDESQSN